MMLIGDGVTPGNEGRGYVLRRLLRRAVRSMRLLGYEDRALPELLPVSRDKMGETYADLHRDWERISQVAYAEEDAFRQTLRAGTTIFDQAAAEVKALRGDTVLSGERAFALHDTYGFPIDLTLEMAQEQGLDGRRGRLPRADGRAAGSAPRRTPAPRRAATPTPRPTARWPTRSGSRSSSPATARWSPRARVRGLVRDGEVVGLRAARATRSSWSSTARRSTPRAAVSSPTRA